MLLNLDKLNILEEKKKRVLQVFVDELLDINGDIIKSINLYGSVASGDYIKKKSNINIMVIVEDINYEVLSKNRDLIKKYSKKYNIATLILSEFYIKTSSDVFPIEFYEFKENYILIYGEDYLRNLEFDSDNLRLQCEEYIKGHLIRFYQVCLETGSTKLELEKILYNSINTILPTFRGILRLINKKIPYHKNELIEEFSNTFDLDKQLLCDVIDIYEKKYNYNELNKILELYIKELQKISLNVDGLQV